MEVLENEIAASIKVEIEDQAERDAKGALQGQPLPQGPLLGHPSPQGSLTLDPGVHLIHQRLPKLVTNIQGRSTSILTPNPVPKNPLRTEQVQRILEPLNLSLLKSAKQQRSRGILKQEQRPLQESILESLCSQNPAILSLADLHLEKAKFQAQNNCPPLMHIPSPAQVLLKTRRNYAKAQNAENDAATTDVLRANRLSKILDSVQTLDGSIPLRKRSWMLKPEIGSAKANLQSQFRLQRRLRKQIASKAQRTVSSTNTAQLQNIKAESQSDAVDAEKKSVPTKAQLKQVPKRKPSKSRHRVLVLQKKFKTRPGTLFKCRRTRERFTFTTVHRTITEPGLALLTAAYALKTGAAQVPVPKVKENEIKLPSSIDLNSSLRTLLQCTSAVPTNLAENCHCHESALKSKSGIAARSSLREPAFIARKSSLENPSMVLVNRYTQSFGNEIADSAHCGSLFDLTIELLAYSRGLERKIQMLKTENVLLDIGKRPQLKVPCRTPLPTAPLHTIPIEKNYIKDALSRGVSDFLAHAGFTQASLSSVEILSEILTSYYEKLAVRLKSVAEKEAAGISHGFLDPMDRVTTELGLGGVRGLGEYYEQHVIGYHKTVEHGVDTLENKLGTLMAIKVKAINDSPGSSRTTSVSAGAGAGNRISRQSTVRESPKLPTPYDGAYLYDSRPNSVETVDFKISLQIDSIPSLGSV